MILARKIIWKASATTLPNTTTKHALINCGSMYIYIYKCVCVFSFEAVQIERKKKSIIYIYISGLSDQSKQTKTRISKERLDHGESQVRFKQEPRASTGLPGRNRPPLFRQTWSRFPIKHCWTTTQTPACIGIHWLPVSCSSW